MTLPIETDFDEWLAGTFARAGAFTILFVLLDIGETHVGLRRSAFLHVLGDEIRWSSMVDLLDSAGIDWSGVVFFQAGREGIVDDEEARRRLAALVRKMHEDRTLIRDGAFFNRDGLSLQLSELPPN